MAIDDDTVALKQIIRLLMGCFYASCDCSYGNDVVVQSGAIFMDGKCHFFREPFVGGFILRVSITYLSVRRV